MTALATGTSKTFTLRDTGSVTISTSGGIASVLATPTGGTAQTTILGPTPSRLIVGPFAEGATVVITNQSATLDYDQPYGSLVTLNDAGTSLVSGDGITKTIGDLAFPYRSANSAGAMCPPQNWGGKIIAADYSISSGSPTVTIETRNGRECIKIVTGSGVTANVDLVLTGDVSWYGRSVFEVEGGRSSGVDQASILITNDNFTNYAQNTYTTQTTPLNLPLEPGTIFAFRADGQVTSGATSYQYTGFGAAWSVSSPTLDGAATTVNKIRFRVIPVAATVATIYVYGVSLGPRRSKGRVFVTADDGYKSFIQAGFPILSARGIPVTISTISNLMDNRILSSNYMQWDDLRNVVASGGQVVAHGPMNLSGAGNLIANYTTNAERIADMQQARDLINANGCGTPNFDKCYVWPQGNFQSATGDMTLLDAAIAAGFTVGRSASPSTNQRYDFSALSKYQRLAVPIIGHSYAGGSESTNITTITSAISAAATDKSDIVLMFHKVVKNADTPDAIGITTGNLATIADAIKTAIDAGTMTAGVLSDIATPDSWMR